jgi:hypothetical protein
MSRKKRKQKKGYANQRSVYSERFSVNYGMGISFYGEIIKGLRQKKFTKSRRAEYLAWAENIGESQKRIAASGSKGTGSCPPDRHAISNLQEWANCQRAGQSK